MFMYESTLTRRPLYSVSPHFSRMITGSLILILHPADVELEWFFMFVCVSVCMYVYICACVCMCSNGRFGMEQRLRGKKMVGRGR